MSLVHLGLPWFLGARTRSGTLSEIAGSLKSPSLSQDLIDDPGFFLDSRQTMVKPLELKGQSLMIDAELAENRGVYVSNVHRVSDDIVAKVIRLTVDDPALYAPASHPACKAFRMMITPVVIAAEFTLAINRPPEFTAPDD